jgi:hypothetical protein
VTLVAVLGALGGALCAGVVIGGLARLGAHVRNLVQTRAGDKRTFSA